MDNITIRRILNIGIIALLLLFIFQNLEKIKVKFLIINFEMPLFLIIVIAFIIGFFSAKMLTGK